MTTQTERLDDFHLLSAAHPDHPMGAVGSFLYSLESNEPLGAKAAMIGAHAFKELLVDLPLMAQMFPGAVEGYITRIKAALASVGTVADCMSRFAAIRKELDESQLHIDELLVDQKKAKTLTDGLDAQLKDVIGKAEVLRTELAWSTSENAVLKTKIGVAQTPESVAANEKTMKNADDLVEAAEASQRTVEHLAENQSSQAAHTDATSSSVDEAEEKTTPKFMRDWVAAMEHLSPDLDQAVLFNIDAFVTDPKDRAFGDRPGVPLSIDALDAIVQMSEGRDNAETGWRKADSGTIVDASNIRARTYPELTRAWKALRNLSTKHRDATTNDAFSTAIGDLTRALLFADYVTAYAALSGRTVVGVLEKSVLGTGRGKKILFDLIADTPKAFKVLNTLANTRNWYLHDVVQKYVTSNMAMTAKELTKA